MRLRTTWRRATRPAAVVAVIALALAACDGDTTAPATDSATPTDTSTAATTVQLLTHDSFNVSEDVMDAFTASTGITIEILRGGDAGRMVNQAILTAGNPQADVLFGLDNTLLSRAIDGEVFTAHEPFSLDAVDPALVAGTDGLVVPIDRGDVCLNYDKAALADAGVEPPATLEDLTDPAYAGMLAIENPATSSPGLAFLLGTISYFGDGWTDWWADLSAADVSVSAGWEEAYYGEFSHSGGTRPLVVSYASSPPAEVIFAEEPLDDAPTGVIEGTCVRQVEYAGILDGTDNPDAAQQVLEWLLSPEFQADVPLSMFVFPARSDVDLPEEFVAYTVLPADPIELDPAEVAANRDEWIDEWTRIVLG